MLERVLPFARQSVSNLACRSALWTHGFGPDRPRHWTRSILPHQGGALIEEHGAIQLGIRFERSSTGQHQNLRLQDSYAKTRAIILTGKARAQSTQIHRHHVQPKAEDGDLSDLVPMML
jgi:hypothetical protein